MSKNQIKRILAMFCVVTMLFGNLPVAAIAEMLHLDRSYFYVIFKKHTGLSPQEYINKYRLKMAMQYLKDGMSPGKTAAVCGYSDVFNFSKMFKKEYGVSPSVYLNKK